jgi:hypothetical protein
MKLNWIPVSLNDEIAGPGRKCFTLISYNRVRIHPACKACYALRMRERMARGGIRPTKSETIHRPQHSPAFRREGEECSNSHSRSEPIKRKRDEPREPIRLDPGNSRALADMSQALIERISRNEALQSRVVELERLNMQLTERLTQADSQIMQLNGALQQVKTENWLLRYQQLPK